MKIVLAAKRKAVKAEMILRRRSKSTGVSHNSDGEETSSPEFVLSVAPDIVVHRRQVDEDNLLVIELKKDTNKEDPRYDDLKLTQFTQRDDYHYELGAAVVAMDDLPGKKRFLRVAAIYEDGVKVWPKQTQATP